LALPRPHGYDAGRGGDDCRIASADFYGTDHEHTARFGCAAGFALMMVLDTTPG
jgi:hypothetical protein